jgi:hypothetical protein
VAAIRLVASLTLTNIFSTVLDQYS